MNTSKPDPRLLYELNIQRRRLDLEIIAAEKQLENVQKRLDGLKHDLYIYLGLLTVPVIVFVILNVFSMIPSKSFMYILVVILKYLILCIYIIMLPANTYHLIYAIILLRINKENDLAVDLPLLEGVRKGTEPIYQEKTFRSEHDKLLLVLTRYYLNKERLEQLHKQITANSCKLTLEDLKKELNKIPYYEDIKPANVFDSSMQKKAKKNTTSFIFIVCMCVLIFVCIGIFV